MTVCAFTAVLHKEDDLYVAECPEVGTVSEGRNMEEAIANLKEATELCLEGFPLPEASRPLLITFEAAYGQTTAKSRRATGFCASMATRELGCP